MSLFMLLIKTMLIFFAFCRVYHLYGAVTGIPINQYKQNCFIAWDQLLLELSVYPFNTLQICYRHIVDVHEGV